MKICEKRFGRSHLFLIIIVYIGSFGFIKIIIRTAIKLWAYVNQEKCEMWTFLLLSNDSFSLNKNSKKRKQTKQDMAMLSSAMACAPITGHATGSVNNLTAFGEAGATSNAGKAGSVAGAVATTTGSGYSTSASGRVLLHTITTSLSEQKIEI